MANKYSKIISGTDTIAAAETAQGSGSYLIKSDYTDSDSGDITFSDDNVKIVVQVGATVSQKFIFAGDAIKIYIHTGATIGDIDSTGTGNYVFLDNGATAGVMQQITSGLKLTVRGGGWGALIERGSFLRNDGLCEFLSINSTSGTGLTVAGNRSQGRFLNIIDTTSHGILLNNPGTFAFGNIIQDSLSSGIRMTNARCTAKNNIVINSTLKALSANASATDCVVAGNYLSNGGADPVDVDASASNNIITKNRMVGQVTAIGGTDTVVMDNHMVPGSANIAIWLDANLDVTGDPVESWIDQINATAFAEATNRPDFIASGLNSLPEIHFNGSNDILDTTTIDLTGSSGGVWAVITIDLLDANPQAIFCISDKDMSDQYVWLGIEATNDRLRVISNNGVTESKYVSTTVLTQATSYIVAWISTGSAYRLFINGAEETLVQISGANNGNWFGSIAGADIVTVGAQNVSGEARHFDGKISEIVALDGASPSDAEINSFNNYLNNKYAVY